MRKSKPALAAEPLPELPKDDEEEELEKMLFGDAEGFRAGLEAVSAAPEESDDDEDMRDADEDEEGLKEIGEEAARDFAALNDDQLFFVDDTAPGGELAMRDEEPVGMELDTVDGEALAAAKPVWEDSDDERMAISLASQGRTRKLRNNEEDDVVSGREYAMRLRRQ